MPMKTPGVYIVEKHAYPSSVVGAGTTVPMFIVYTRKAIDGSTSLTNKPWRISSLADYEPWFGGASDAVFMFQAAASGVRAVLPAMVAARGQEARFTVGNQDHLLTRAAGKAGGRFLLHRALRHFFQTGGGTCYLVSVGDYAADISAAMNRRAWSAASHRCAGSRSRPWS